MKERENSVRLKNFNVRRSRALAERRVAWRRRRRLPEPKVAQPRDAIGRTDRRAQRHVRGRATPGPYLISRESRPRAGREKSTGKRRRGRVRVTARDAPSPAPFVARPRARRQPGRRVARPGIRATRRVPPRPPRIFPRTRRAEILFCAWKAILPNHK